MNRIFSFVLLLALGLGNVCAETIVGTISKDADGKILLKDPYTQEVLTLKMKGAHSKFMDSFLSYNTYLRFTGDKINGEFVADRTPVIVSGPSRIEGKLTFDNNKTYIGQQEVVFNEAKKVNGYSFNGDSIKSFNKKQVIVNGKLEDGVLQVSAIIPADLYSANPDINTYQLGTLHSKFANDPLDYVLNTLPKNMYSQSNASFRGTLIDESRQVQKSDHALVITLSGRQGDDLGAANGHFAIGIAEVKDDLSLDMEVHNYYPPKNEKEIIPGFIDFVDYYGGTTSGQNNYRSTYTVVIYGESRERLLEMRDSLDEEFSKLRLGMNNFSISSNCTTVSVQGLNGIGITGEHQRLHRKILQTKNILRVNPFYHIGDPKSMLRQLSYSLAKNPAYYIPRPAFDSLLKNMGRLMKNGTLEGYRVDYIFQSQTPSDRPLGGTSANDFLETIKTSMKDRKHNKDPFSPEEISSILDKID